MATSRAVPVSPSLRTRLAAAASVAGLRQINGILPRNRVGIGAGRGLIAATMAGTEQPAGVFMFSPLMDLTFALAGQQDRLRRDPMASARVGKRLVELYITGQSARSPRLRSTIPSKAALPPLFVQASAEEMLAGDAHHLRDMAMAAGTRCDLELWPGRIHVFQALPRLVPEAESALRHTAHFVASAFAEAEASIQERVS